VVFISTLISCKPAFDKVIFTDANIEQYTRNNEYTAIVYVDSTGGCRPCAFQYLNSWKAYQKTLNKNNTEILLVINYSDEQLVIEILRSIGVFVIDRDKNVIFAGSPIMNEEKWNAYRKIIEK
jgi:Icc-related predicted phosphoesterase